jgi:hypothetical protein
MNPEPVQAPQHPLFQQQYHAPQPVMPEQSQHHQPQKSSTCECKCGQQNPLIPIAVSKVASPNGFKYYLMFISLWVSVGAIVTSLNLWILGGSGGIPSAAIAAIVTFLPVYVIFFFINRRQEKLDAAQLTDPSRRRPLQITLFVAFLTILANIFYFILTLIQDECANSYASTCTSPSVSKNILQLLTTILVVGGVFAYYYIGERTLGNKNAR